MFAEEKPALLPLPLEPFRYYQYGERTVHLDGCVEVEAAYYSAPPRLDRPPRPGAVGRCNGSACSIPRTGQLLREHLRKQRGRHRIQDEDRPQRTPLGHAAAAGPRREGRPTHRRFLPKPCTATRPRPPSAAFRACCRCQKKYGAARVDDGLRHGPGNGDLRLSVSCAAIWSAICSPPLSLRQVDPLIRQLTLYRDLIEERTDHHNQETNE